MLSASATDRAVLAARLTVTVTLVSACAHRPAPETLVPASCIQPTTSQSPTLGGYSTGERMISATTRAHFFIARDSSSDLLRGYVLFVRGAAGWQFASSVGSHEGLGGAGWQVGTTAYAVEHHFKDGSATILGVHIGLDTANVILLDHVDSAGGPPTVQTLGCVGLEPSRSLLDRALSLLPRIGPGT